MKKILKTLLVLFFAIPNFYCAEIDSSKIEKVFDIGKLHDPSSFPKESTISKLKKDLNKKNLEGFFYYNWSLYMYYRGNLDSAMHVAQKGISICEGRLDQNSSEMKILNLLASYHSVKQEYTKAFEYYQTALKMGDELNDDLMMAKININVANLYFGLLDYEKAYNHSKQGYELIKKYPDDRYFANILSVLAVCESKLGKYEEGLVHAKIALSTAKKKNDLFSIVIANHCFGEIYINQKKIDLAESHFVESLKLSEEIKNLNLIILNNIGLLHTYLEMKNFQKAIAHGQEALNLLKNDTDKTRIYAVKRQLAEAYGESGMHNLAYKLMAEAHQNYLEKSGIEIQESIKELEVKFETEKKEKELIQSKFNLIKKDVEIQKILLYSALLAILVLFLASSILFIRYRNRKKIEILAKQKERQVIEAVLVGEETERERLALELHDGLASVLTAARYKIQSIDADDKKGLNDLSELLKNAHEDTRRMSHKLAPLKLEQLGLITALKHFCSDNSVPSCEVKFTDLTQDLTISNEKILILYRVGQELVQNALKHSQASIIQLQIKNEAEWVSIIVEDNGVGFDQKSVGETNGLGSIQKRVEQLEGDFHYDSSPENGTVSYFKIPIKLF